VSFAAVGGLDVSVVFASAVDYAVADILAAAGVPGVLLIQVSCFSWLTY
jgi:hypothetical protein